MLFFIPAWYKENTWNEDEQIWYVRREKSELDETIKQITLFHRNVKQDYHVLVLGYSPNLRHFLHRQGMFRASYWSCFDAIAQIRRRKVSVLSYHDMAWPEGTEFVNSSFAVLAFINGEKYAKVEFGEDGNPISIDMYKEGVICRRNFYDDRGFVSSTVIFENGKEKYQDFLTENGTWKLRLFYSDGHVCVNPLSPSYDIEDGSTVYEILFSKPEYASMSDVVEEVLTEYVKCATKDDRFFVAAHPLHMEVLKHCLQKERYIVTFFEDRFDYENINQIRDFLIKAEYIITDSKLTSIDVKRRVGERHLNIMDIPPFDSRVDFGVSRELKVQNILVPIDGIEKSLCGNIILQVADYLKKNEFARAHLFSRDACLSRNDKCKEELADFLQKNGFEKEWVIKSSDNPDREKVRFFFDICVDERDVSKCINEQRVILDLRKKMDVYMFITAISKGVPRISMQKDQFFEHMKNGYQIDDCSQIQPALSYYLDNFENWNAALISCYELSQKYSTDVLLASWRKVLGIVE